MGKTHDDEDVIDLMELFIALKRKIVVLLAALLIGAAAAGAYTQFLVTPMYSASSMLLVLTKETTLSSLADLQIGSQLTQDYSLLLTTRTVMEEVVDNLGLDMTYKELEECIEISYPSDTRIMEITVQYPDPEMAKTIVDEVADVGAEFIGDQMEVVPPKIVEKGEVPKKPTSPSMMKNVAIGGLAGLVLAAGIVVLLTILDDTVKSEDDVEKYLGLSTLASIPDRKDYISGGKTSNNRKRPASKKKKHRRKRRK